MNDKRPDVALALSTLKDFQRATVDYIFERLYTGSNPRRRFLLADEVGLGKTLVARGVVARAVDYLWDAGVKRIDVVYICSNGAIARQNVNRLQLPGMEKVSLASRITLLPKIVKNLNENRVNFVSFTPGTSFDMKSRQGIVEERVLLFHLLEETLGIPHSAAITLLQGEADRDRFKNSVASLDREEVDTDLANAFRSQIDPAFLEEIRSFANNVIGMRKKLDEPEERSKRSEIVGKLRSTLAASCLRALEPDLIILDEFQRFKSLLDDDDDASRLARELFNYESHNEKARVLLMSATPYKMYTLEHETDEDHYADFLRTVKFLLDDDPKVPEQWAAILAKYRTAITELNTRPSAREELRAITRDIESRLREVMVRTERLAASSDRNGMLKGVPSEGLELQASDLTAYVGLHRIAAALDLGDPVEYWKSAPYLLNFMDEYELKKEFAEMKEKERVRQVSDALAKYPQSVLSWSDIRKYSAIDPQNARIRALVHDVIDSGAWELLWVSPTLPYYELSSPFANPQLRRFTKRLVFSSWKVVPKTIAALLTYDVERRAFGRLEEQPENSVEARRRRKPLLRFTRALGRLTGMPVVALVYPSTCLAQVFDPASYVNHQTRSSLQAVLEDITETLRPLLDELPAGGGEEDESWYWAAPVLLDLAADAKRGTKDTRGWFKQEGLDDLWTGGSSDESPSDAEVAGDEQAEESAWAKHVSEVYDLVMRGEHGLGKKPADLAETIALLAVAGPAVCSLRALSRTTGGVASLSAEHRNAAGKVAHALIRLFNEPEAMACIRGRDRREPYWRRVLEYAAAGCLQSVLDEYVHVLYELSGLAKYSEKNDVLDQLSESIIDAVDLRTANVGADRVEFDAAAGQVSVAAKERMRARFALRYGDERSEDGKVLTRGEQVAASFNSPFWPFVLATTSVGQEGLDFHPYCHAVVHWNLPSNPVDLEQREGRIHRYKGHAVRKNVAQKCAATITGKAPDPWRELFDRACDERRPGEQDLVPYWIFPLENGASIERHVPALPLSRDLQRLEQLRRALAVYRMVFGQNRQDDLVECLLKMVPEARLAEIVTELKIDLSPRAREAAV